MKSDSSSSSSSTGSGSIDNDKDGKGEGGIVYTPSGTESPLHALQPTHARSHQNSPSRSPLRIASLPTAVKQALSPERQHQVHFEDAVDERSGLDVDQEHEEDDDDDDMAERRKSPRDRDLANTPLLESDTSADLRGRPFSYETERTSTSAGAPMAASGRSHRPQRSAFRSASPTYATPANLTRRKYIYAAFFLALSLVSFVVQTETAVYIQHELKWDKAYCMLWLTHSSWSLLWPAQLLILRIQKRKLSWTVFWRRHKYLIRSTAQMVQSQDLYLSPATLARSPWPYFLKTTSFITTFLTIAGASWYMAVNMTSPSDLTAIYNCSAFFAYVFSILLLGDKWRSDKLVSVGLAIIGVLVVAYGDQDNPKHGSHSGGSTDPNHDDSKNSTSVKLLGNIIIGIGSVMYGLYEVLYKKYACPPEGTSPGRGMIFANTFGSMIGCFTLCVLWIPLPILHWTGLEHFELPRGKTAALLAVSTLSNAIFSGSFLVLMSLTSPVLSSVAALLTIFLVAITDWVITGKPLSAAAISGGVLIILAFAMLSFATYREMTADQKRRAEQDEGGKIVDDDDSLEDGTDQEDGEREDGERQDDQDDKDDKDSGDDGEDEDGDEHDEAGHLVRGHGKGKGKGSNRTRNMNINMNMNSSSNPASRSHSHARTGKSTRSTRSTRHKKSP